MGPKRGGRRRGSEERGVKYGRRRTQYKAVNWPLTAGQAIALMVVCPALILIFIHSSNCIKQYY